ncbi:RNA polymerase sigma factor [Ruminococcaceae bacterium OttesenSCG-928-A16]|nr:RNA polymerase sigma factor [Ruminococcaceae bacterium OttesenSCG-928-A16]
MKTEHLYPLIEKAADGDKAAFIELCNEVGKDVLFICVKIMGHWQDGEDAAQEVFIKMQKGIKNLQNPASFTVWLNRIIKSACNNARLKTMKQKANVPLDETGELLLEDKMDFLPPEFLEEKDKQKTLLQAIDTLPEKYRTVIVFYYYEEMTHAQIAEVLGSNVNTVDHTLRRARMALQKKLGQQGYGLQTAYAIVGGVPVLTKVLQAQKAELTRDVTIALLLEKSGVVATSIGAGFTGAATKIIVGALLVVAAVLGGAALWGNIFSGSPPLQQGIPVVSVSVATGSSAAGAPPQSRPVTEDTALRPDIGISSTAALVPTLALAPSLPVVEPPASAPVPAASAIHKAALSGKFVFVNNQQQPVEGGGRYASGFTVKLYRGTTFLGEALAGPDGTFVIENLPVLAAGEYRLQAVAPFSRTANFAQNNPGGKLTVTVAQDGSYEPPVFTITDETPPSVSMVLYNAAGSPTRTNPTAGEIVVGDVTQTICSWQIMAPGGQTPIASGTGASLTKALSALQAGNAQGALTIQATVADAAGNTSVEARTIYLVI